MNLETREQFPLLLNELGLKGYGAEIGVQQGHFASTLLKGWGAAKIYLVDAWRQIGPEREDNPNPDGQLHHYAETFKAAYFHHGRAVIIREFSVEAATLFPDGHFDFIYIDAAHDEVNVQKDLEAWYPKVRSGGVFAGHDYYDGYVHWDRGGEGKDEYTENRVKSVVDAFLKEKGHDVNSTSKDLFPSWWSVIKK